MIDRLHISSGKTLCFPASSAFLIYFWFLWCTPIIYTTICLLALHSRYHGLAIKFYTVYYEPIICQLSLHLGPPTGSLFFCVVVPDYIYLLTILQHTWALSSESSDSTQGFTGSRYYTPSVRKYLSER